VSATKQTVKEDHTGTVIRSGTKGARIGYGCRDRTPMPGIVSQGEEHVRGILLPVLGQLGNFAHHFRQQLCHTTQYIKGAWCAHATAGGALRRQGFFDPLPHVMRQGFDRFVDLGRRFPSRALGALKWLCGDRAFFCQMVPAQLTCASPSLPTIDVR
jgi:hypothetical protein